MKIKRSLLAAAITLAAAACSGDVTAPDPSLRDGARQSTAPEATTTNTPAPTVVPEEPVEGGDGTGAVGSGCCANR